LGTYLVSSILDRPERFELDGRTYAMQLRFKRHYKPYQIKLLQFRFDRYTGTNTPRNFSSLVQLIDPAHNVDREVKIWMNHPLRYRGETFYQQAFDPRTEKTTTLQIVRNPGWLIPYISCVMVGLGLVVHFGMHLVQFLSRIPVGTSAKPQAAMSGGATIFWPVAATALCCVFVLMQGRAPKAVNGFDIAGFARVPVLYEGRVMPMDSLARNSLRVISGKAEVHDGDKSTPAIQWLLDTLAQRDTAGTYRIFRIDHPEIVSLLKLDSQRDVFSFNEIAAQGSALDQQFKLLSDLFMKDGNSTRNFDLFQLKLWDLIAHLNLFNELRNIGGLYIAPPTKDGEEWKTIESVAQSARAGEAVNPGAKSFITMIQAYDGGQPATFNATVAEYPPYLKGYMPEVVRKTDFEVLYNRFEPFITASALYVLVFVLTAIGWLGRWETLRRTAFWVLCLTLAVHTLGLVARIYISGRPPVTNLYSSAIFIGWAAVVLCVGVEVIFRNGLGSLAASVMAFPTLIIAHYLAPMSENGDTMHMLRAVLDTNIWLATHVVVITLGYAATFLAGIVAIVYLLLGVFTRYLSDASLRKDVSRVIYGILCFAMLFSFVGTVLGGIWADQSWGRFWGWDAKENGAVLIVLWNAIVLHARWAGLIRERGMAVLALVGNIVTSWSWFGTNMLGVGLHSYGFMEAAAFWLGVFVLSQVLLIGLGLLPLHLWRSFRVVVHERAA
jgi:ABC-type transport system involved in cytochrome c biogenesis permease subunit